MATFRVKKAEVFFGTLDRQVLELKPKKAKTGEIFTKNEWIMDESSNFNEEVTIHNLRRHESYYPHLSIFNEINLRDGSTITASSEGQYQNLTQLMIECPGKYFITSTWTCPESNQSISSLQLCDGNDDCPNAADEAEWV